MMRPILCSLLLVAAADAAPKKPATVLLVTSEDLKEAWQPFADWKTQQGKATKIITVKDIEARYQGKDVQDKIRQCALEHAEKHGTRFLILGGDSQPGGKGHVPDRDTRHVVYGSKKKLRK